MIGIIGAGNRGGGVNGSPISMGNPFRIPGMNPAKYGQAADQWDLSFGSPDERVAASKRMAASSLLSNPVEQQPTPPTLEDAQKKLRENGSGLRSYGRAGTLTNYGGYSGIAANTLNLSSQSLTGT